MVQSASRTRHLSLVPNDRRERQREERRRRILGAADALLAEHGLEGITMQRVADQLDCAVGTLYLYFPSKSALVAALQGRAIDTLRSSYEAARPDWDAYLAEAALGPELSSLVLLAAFGSHWVSASVVLADEFQLQRGLLSERVPLSSREEVREVLPLLDRLLENPETLIRSAIDQRVLDPGSERERSLVWLAALDGVLLLEHLAPVDRHLFRPQHLARRLTQDLLMGWGAERADVEVADGHVERLALLGPMAPPPTDYE